MGEKLDDTPGRSKPKRRTHGVRWTALVLLAWVVAGYPLAIIIGAILGC
jgi:hypothetical protein